MDRRVPGVGNFRRTGFQWLEILSSALLLVASLVPARAQFAVPWQKVAGGGFVQGTGGVFGVGMTSGQWDAGVRTGGVFATSDGFWALNESAIFAPAQVLGFFVAAGVDDATQAAFGWQQLAPRAAGFQSYVIYYTGDGTEPSTNSPSFTVTHASQLGQIPTTNFTGTNLTYEATYRFRIAGRDGNGRLGPISSVVTQQLGTFVATQAVVQAGGGVQVRWNARPGAAYDVIYQDATSWSDTLTNGWRLLATVTNSFPVDTGSVSRTAPHLLGGATMRFYRVASVGSWMTSAATRVATREIFVARPFVLVPGENWVALAAPPVSNTLAAVFGTNLLPAGASLATATRISWYAAANNAIATNVIWLSDSGHWLHSVGGEGVADGLPLPVTHGFNVEIPGTATQRLVVLGTLTASASTYTIAGSSGGESYSLRALAAPRRTGIAQTGLKAVLTAGINPTVADEIRVLDNAAGIGSRTSPRHRLWLRSSDNTFRYTPGGASAENHVFEPGDVLVIVRRSPDARSATNAVFFSAPGRTMNP